MTRKQRVAIAEPSLIIRMGLFALLKRFTALPMEIFELNQTEHLDNLLIRHKPDILIINPLCIDANHLAQLKKNPKFSGIKYIANQTSMMDIRLLKQYDQIITLSMEAEQIKDVLSKLIHKDSADSLALSDREKDIIIAVAEGLTNKMIASKLNISTNTVMTHRKNISNKLNIHSQAGIILYAIANRLIEC
ncbi:MAG: LuxR C-terminal-related transcriptional regulator [Bacteroidales bacterium]|jgi:DNA-binding NarL/FixJ family response regulator|nr:LuxR C-terminal-related transcriptional regulator [Bacteroidales bacterium]